MFRKERNNMDSLRYFLIEAKKQTYANENLEMDHMTMSIVLTI